MSRFNQFYSLKLVIKYGLLMAGFFMACKVSGSLAYPIIIPVALYFASMHKFEELFFIVLIAISSIICGPWFMPKPFVFAISQRGLLVMLGGLLLMTVFGRRNAPLVSPLRVFLIYIFYMIFASIDGWAPIISGLKLFLFFSIFMSFYASANAVAQQKHGMRKLRSMVLAVICFFIVGSLLTIPLPAISQMSYEMVLQMQQSGQYVPSLFQGVTCHSQTLGPVIAMCAVLIFGDFAFSIQRKDKLYVALLLVAAYLLYKTSSRTAMGGLIAGIFFVFWCLMQARTVKRNWKSRLIQSGFLLGAFACMAILVVPSMRAKTVRFVLKYGDVDTKQKMTTEDVLSTRMGNFERALYNWRRSPVFGNGFQVSDSMQGFKAKSIRDVMTAPVEKSIWISAILEEGGVVGEALFCLIVAYILLTLVKRKSYIGASCFFTMLVLNLGEFSIFSLSGVGGFSWGIVFAGCAMDSRRERERLAALAKAQAQMVPPPWAFVPRAVSYR